VIDAGKMNCASIRDELVHAASTTAAEQSRVPRFSRRKPFHFSGDGLILTHQFLLPIALRGPTIRLPDAPSARRSLLSARDR
jgi:hypothetical protein